jgi:hypothetical protein
MRYLAHDFFLHPNGCGAILERVLNQPKREMWDKHGATTSKICLVIPATGD